MAPTPSWARAESMEAKKSPLAGAMFAAGLAGGNMPTAPAGAAANPDATELTMMTPMGSNSVATQR